MTIQEAFNRGLDVAEKNAIEKISKALNGEDCEQFSNPEMEEFRQQILKRATPMAESYPSDVQTPVVDEELIAVSTIVNLLMGNEHPTPYPTLSEKGRLIAALTTLMSFIHTRASKGNNGSKNYREMVETLKKDLTFEQKPLQ